MKRDTFLSFSPPAISELEVDEVVATIREGHWLANGPKVKAFEAAFRGTVSAPAALALNSCTAGLHLAMLAHRVGPGDQVITTPMTFAATANVVEHVGADVVFADVEPDTLLIDPREVERRLTKKTKVILPVHFAGHPCDVDTLSRFGRTIVEDAAHCTPSKIGDRWVGNTMNLCSFSFYATKNITTGEGGMLTGDPALIEAAKRLASHGMNRDAWQRFGTVGSFDYDIPEPGFKYIMSDVAASLGLAQLQRLPELYQRRLSVVDFYEENFRDNPFVKTLRVKPGYQSSRHLYVVLLQLERLTIDRARFVAEMHERNIGCSVHYKPVHMMSHYAKKYGLRPDDYPNASHAYERTVSLPLNSRMSLTDAQDVVTAAQDIFKKFMR